MTSELTGCTPSTAHDPDYALAWAGLATAHAGRVINGDADPGVVRPPGWEAAVRAARVDPNLAEAQHALGLVNWMLEWLERAYAARDVHLIYPPVDAKWDRYRTDPRFVALLARCNFTPR